MIGHQGKTSLLVCTSALAALTGLLGTRADAATAAGPATAAATATTASASGEAPGAEPSTPGEIVVTANKRSETLVKVPQSITAISGDKLDYRNQSSIEDFAAQVPGLNFESFGNRAVKLVLRGINSGSTAATTAIVVDETPFTYQSGLALGDRNTPNLDTFDMDHIEVLKGPQGTLYGAAAEGGLLKYVTRKPNVDKFEAETEVGGQVVDQGQAAASAKAMVNIPFWDGKGAIRFTGFYIGVPGYIDNVLAGVDNANHGHRYGGRISVLLKPTDTLTLRLTGFRQDQRFGDDGSVEVVGANLDPLNPPANQYDIANGGRLEQNSHYGNPSNNTYEYVNLTANWDMGFADLLSSTSYGKLSSEFRLDISYGSAAPGLYYVDAFGEGYEQPLALRTRQTNSGQRWNQEFRLSSKPGSEIGGMHVDWLVGAFFAHESNTFDQFFQFQNVATGEELSSPAPGGGSTNPSEYREFSGFANATLHFTDQLFAQGGVRYASIHQSSHDTNFPGYFTGVTEVTDNPTLTSQEHKTTWSAQLGYNFTPSSLLYARVATGYRAGGPQYSIAGAPADLPTTYKPDSLTNYEAGIRTNLFGKLLSIDLAAYYIDWKNIQINTTFQSSVSGIAYQVTGNAGQAESKGVEWAVTLSPAKWLQISDTGSYIDAHLTADAPGIGGFKGDTLAYVPHWSNTLNIDAQFDVSADVKGFAGGSWSYIGKRYADFNTLTAYGFASHYVLPHYNTLNVQAGVNFGRYGVSVYGQNIANSRGLTTYDQLDGYNYTGLATIVQPRTIGIKFTAKY